MHKVNSPSIYYVEIIIHFLGLLNLFHAMEGRDHIHLVFVKNNELPFYQKIWPNHVLVGLPPSCNLRGLGTAKDIMKVGPV